jgi:hypothetical protein
MAHWSLSPKAQEPGIKLFIFKCQSSTQHLRQLTPRIDTGSESRPPWVSERLGWRRSHDLGLSPGWDHVTFRHLICIAVERKEKPGEQEFYSPSQFHGVNPPRAIYNL